MRDDCCGGWAGKVALLTGIEGASSRRFPDGLCIILIQGAATTRHTDGCVTLSWQGQVASPRAEFSTQQLLPVHRRMWSQMHPIDIDYAQW
jgi:hypothetical protein